MLIHRDFKPIESCQLAKNRIDIWQFSLNETPKAAENLLNEEEIIRANRFYFSRHKRRFTVARAQTRLILSRYIPELPESLQFHTNHYGKPGLQHSENICFNLSHSRDLALLAVGQQHPMGVDLEFFSPRSYHGIAKQLFSPEELQYYLALPNYLKPKCFFEIWAKKEAFIKACGMGLSYPTKQFTVPMLAYDEKPIFEPLHNQHWLIRSFMPQALCYAALCYHPDIEEIRFIPIN